MPHKIGFNFRLVAAGCLALSLLSALAWLAPAAAPTVASAQSAGSIFVRKVSLRANDVAYSTSTNMLYVSVPSGAGASGNSIAPVDPLTGVMGTPVFVGSEPSQLAISDDGNTMYVSLEGAFAIRRFDVQTQTPGVQFPVGSNTFHGTYRVNDLAVAPGSPDTVAVARHYLSTSPPQVGVAIFDNGVQRPMTGPGHISGSDYVAYSASPSKLYGGGSGGLRTMTIDATGVTSTTYSATSVGTHIKMSGGLVYGAMGLVMNPDTGVLLGTYPLASSSEFVPDAAAGRVFYLTSDGFRSHSFTIRAYDINTFLQVGSHTISGVTGAPMALIRWGVNGLAFCTSSGEVYIIQSALVAPGHPVPTVVRLSAGVYKQV